MTAATSTTHGEPIGEPMMAGSTGMPYIALNVPQGRHCIEHTGTWVALKRYGIPLEGKPAQPITVTGADGHDWHVWSGDSIFVQARRERTPEEQVEYVDRLNARISTDFFSKDRQEPCLRIGRELNWLAGGMTPDRPVTRQCRRRLKKQLLAMSAAMMQLTRERQVSMQEIRASLAQVGIVVPQPDYMARYDEEGN